MVKRVVDMTQQVAADDTNKVDGTKVAQEVNELKEVVEIQKKVIEQEEKKRQALMLLQKPQLLTCTLCEQGIAPEAVRYYDVALLRKFMSVRGKIATRSRTGLCAKHQRAVVRAIKRARQIGLIPYIDTGL